MLPATEEVKQEIIDYMDWQASDLRVEFLQTVCKESIVSHERVVWDVHTTKDRWWVITNPINLYSQTLFPNMDYVVTFHVGLMLRIPRTESQQVSDLSLEPLGAAYRQLNDASEALSQAA